MTITWSEIDKALEELVIHEEGNRFQRLAISLAKQQWPGIIATEIKKDGGEDALSHPYLMKDGKRIDFACSITATWKKIQDDLTSIFERGISPDLLVFYTARKVSNNTADEWKKNAKSEFDCDLLVISKENIIHDLLDPKNDWICSTFLRIQIPISPVVKNAIEKTSNAAYRILKQWQRRYRFYPDYLIDLTTVRLDKKCTPTSEIFHQHEIHDYLSNAGRVILYGAPGAGKTTKLIQIAEHFLETEEKKVPLLISLPDWIESGKNIIDFVLEYPDFLAVGITPTDLASLHGSNHLIIILNGWNEIPTNLMDRGGRQISRIERDYPAAGLIVSTRASDIGPPLYGAIKLNLAPITDDQRRVYINSVLSDSGEELIIQIESDPVLSEITKTPLILSEITKIYKSGERVPNTKTGVLWSVIESMEESEEHRTQIQSAPLYGRASKYLSEISAIMAQEGRTLLHSEKVNEVITSVNKKLLSDGQLTSLHDPKQVVDGLCAHHILVKSDYPFPSVHFLHQQFQELYATNNIKETLKILMKVKDEELINHFQKNILNKPAWGESLKLLAEEIGEEIRGNKNSRSDEIDPLELGTNLVKWCIPVDPIFSAELSRICGSDVRDATKESLEPIFRKWYDLSDESHKSCSLAGMFATGSDIFSDIIWSLIENTDQQIRLKTYRAPVIFFISCLGPDWRKRVNSWDEKRREEFISELGFKGGLDSHIALEEFAKNDPSIEVRTAAIDAFSWLGLFNKLLQMLHHCDYETFKNIVRKGYIPRKIPESLKSRVEKTYPKILLEFNDSYTRLLMLNRLCRIENLDLIETIKAELESYFFKNKKGQREHLLLETIRMVATKDPDWTNKWVTNKYSERKIWGEHWLEFIDDIPEQVFREVFERFIDPNHKDNNARNDLILIEKGATKKHALIILDKLIELQTHSDTSKEPMPGPQRELYFRLKDAVKKLPLAVLVQSIIDNYSIPNNASELRLILELLWRGGAHKDDEKINIKKEILERIRKTLQGYIKLVLAEEDYNGELKAHLSSAISRFGEAKDLSIIIDLINEDIKRINKGVEAFKQGERFTPLVDGFRMRWSQRYIDDICHIDFENADKIILNLLKNPYYERDAAIGLVNLLKGEEEHIDWHPAFLGLSENRSKTRKTADPDHKRKHYATAILNHMQKLRKEHERADKPNEINYRLKELGNILARICDPDIVPIIMEIMALSGEHDEWQRVGALESLIRQDIKLDMSDVEKVLDPVIDRLIERGRHDDQDFGLLERCCVIFIFTNNPIRAIDRIKELVTKYLPVYKMRRLIKALEQIESQEAIKYLIELAQDPVVFKKQSRELIKALSSSRLQTAIKAIMSTIDQEITDEKIPFPDDYFEIQMMAQSIADLCQKDREIENRIFELCNKNMLPKQRELILNVIKYISSTQAIKAGLNMMQESVPYSLLDVIENSFLEKVPSAQFEGSYTLKPRENDEIRSYLFDMVLDDEKRSNSAFSLLSHIDQWRLEHGKPSGESRHPNIKRGVPWPPLDQFM